MKLPDITILLLSLLDIGMFIILPVADKKMHGINLPAQINRADSSLFLNMEYDEPVNRFILSRGGAASLVCLLFLTAFLIGFIR